jgi:hypothetical protein
VQGRTAGARDVIYGPIFARRAKGFRRCDGGESAATVTVTRRPHQILTRQGGGVPYIFN